jgi:hypothetical protein
MFMMREKTLQTCMNIGCFYLIDPTGWKEVSKLQPKCIAELIQYDKDNLLAKTGGPQSL